MAGGVLSGLLGSMMITIARQIGVGFSNLLELEIFLATQALLGIGLGIAISRQQHLAQNLHHYRQRLESELAARRALTEQLVHTEENTRKRLARELHDEIGQNITAIQIQSQLLRQRQEPALVLSAAAQINDLARRIHHSTRQLLRQLRPPALDELSFQEALYHLVNEFAFAERGIRCRFDYRLDAPPAGETVQFTLYRLLQELLNNVCKHADASAVSIVLCYHAPACICWCRITVWASAARALPARVFRACASASMPSAASSRWRRSAVPASLLSCPQFCNAPAPKQEKVLATPDIVSSLLPRVFL
ncbi:histidine kinase [Edwardsiella piscicida]|nr:histidine kinase [Edwardsiella piscicida]